jgi:hypothetical protein
VSEHPWPEPLSVVERFAHILIGEILDFLGHFYCARLCTCGGVSISSVADGVFLLGKFPFTLAVH